MCFDQIKRTFSVYKIRQTTGKFPPKVYVCVCRWGETSENTQIKVPVKLKDSEYGSYILVNRFCLQSLSSTNIRTVIYNQVKIVSILLKYRNTTSSFLA